MNAFLNLFEQRVRGIRLIEVIGLVLALGMIFWVCLSKAREGEDKQQLDQINQQISDETTTVTALKIRVAQLERPARLEALATAYLGMKPVESTHETHLDSLSEISQSTSRPVKVAPVAATPVTAPVSNNELISVGATKAVTTAAPAPAESAGLYATATKTGAKK